MRQRFHYHRYLADPSPADPGRLMLRPMAPIWLSGRTSSMEAEALVDTGAALTIFPMRLVTNGLIDPDFGAGEEENVRVANGQPMRLIYATVNLGIILGDQSFHWGCKVGFTDDRDEPVLGDAGFLRYFAVIFDRRIERFTIMLSGKLPRGNLPPLQAW